MWGENHLSTNINRFPYHKFYWFYYREGLKEASLVTSLGKFYNKRFKIGNRTYVKAFSSVTVILSSFIAVIFLIVTIGNLFTVMIFILLMYLNGRDEKWMLCNEDSLWLDGDLAKVWPWLKNHFGRFLKNFLGDWRRNRLQNEGEFRSYLWIICWFRGVNSCM